MRNVLKRAIGLGCVFIASFMLTVTAFATGFTISSDMYLGHYWGTNNTLAFVDINENRMLLDTYYLDEWDEYVIASSSDGSVDYARYGLYYETGRCCNKNGKLTGATVSDFTVQGKVIRDGLFDLFFIKSITLEPNNQTEKYVLEK